jgi:hypothetical protein
MAPRKKKATVRKAAPKVTAAKATAPDVAFLQATVAKVEEPKVVEPKVDESLYRPLQAFRRKHPDGHWVQFKPWNTYPADSVAWLEDMTLFEKE